MARNDSQCSQILAYIQAMGSITDDEARKVIGCHRLAARISDLRRKGWPIVTDWASYIEDGHTIRYGVYRMEADET